MTDIRPLEASVKGRGVETRRNRCRLRSPARTTEGRAPTCQRFEIFRVDAAGMHIPEDDAEA